MENVGNRAPFVSVFVGLAVLVVLVVAFLGLKNQPITVPAGQDNSIVYTDFTDEEWKAWMDGTVQYNVDVKITSSHAHEKHGNEVVNAALRCVNERGSTAVISEHANRNLHIFCVDPDTKEEYVIIITKIKKSADAFRNATSELVTAFKLRTTIGENVGSYIQRMVVTNGYAIVVKLAFKAGELFFSPF